MIKKTVFLLGIMFVLVLSTSVEAKPRLTVRAFEDRTQEGDAPAAAVTDMLVTELNKAGIFELLEREKLSYITDEIALGQSGLMDPETAPKIGKIKGAQYTMTGAITLYHYNEKAGGVYLVVLGGVAQSKTAYVRLDIRIIDNTTGQIIYTGDQVGSSKQELKGWGGYYKGFGIGSYNRTYGGILASATRQAITQHISAIKAHSWE